MDKLIREEFEAWYEAAAKSGEIDDYMQTLAYPAHIMPFWIGFRAAKQSDKERGNG